MNGAGRIAYLVGARPNYVKMAPLVAQMRRDAADVEHVVINTGQHYDAEMSQIFVDELDLGQPEYELGVGSGSHGMQTGRALERIEAVLAEVRPVALVVPGDVNSTLAGALAAAKLGIPVAHLEAGLRSFDRSMPEEVNRVLTDQVSSWCLTHSPEAADNLQREGIDDNRIFPVGNTMIDTLVRMRPRVERSTVLERLGLVAGSYLLVTLHRPALVDAAGFSAVIEELGRLSEWAPIVFPVHPRTRQRIGSASSGRLHLIEPVGYLDFLALETWARAVVTDSGGIQEETTFLGVPCFTMRRNTERPVTVDRGTNQVIGTDPSALENIPAWLASWSQSANPIPGWDGRAAERAAAVLLDGLGILKRPMEGSSTRVEPGEIAPVTSTSRPHGLLGGPD
jgi:UDP-N-acetylglucosamine 2-epimerase (non-hydrolysing)